MPGVIRRRGHRKFVARFHDSPRTQSCEASPVSTDVSCVRLSLTFRKFCWKMLNQRYRTQSADPECRSGLFQSASGNAIFPWLYHKSRGCRKEIEKNPQQSLSSRMSEDRPTPIECLGLQNRAYTGVQCVWPFQRGGCTQESKRFSILRSPSYTTQGLELEIHEGRQQLDPKAS